MDPVVSPDATRSADYQDRKTVVVVGLGMVGIGMLRDVLSTPAGFLMRLVQLSLRNCWISTTKVVTVS
jgi:hypothetical protein